MAKEALEAVFVEERLPGETLDSPKTRNLFNMLGLALGMMRYVVFGP